MSTEETTTALQKYDPAKPVASRGTLAALLDNQKHKFAEVLPEHLKPERLIKLALVAVSRNEALLECTGTSVLKALMDSAELGLDCSGVLGQGYLVPFRNKDTGAKEAVFIAGYRGLITLARRSGMINDVVAYPVYRSDRFKISLGTDQEIVHEPDVDIERQDNDIIGAYLVAHIKGSDKPHIEWMTRGDIEKVRKRSQQPDGLLWGKNYAEACRKTVVRRGVKYLPMSVELEKALHHENQVDGAIDITSEIQAAQGRAHATNGETQKEKAIADAKEKGFYIPSMDGKTANEIRQMIRMAEKAAQNKKPKPGKRTASEQAEAAAKKVRDAKGKERLATKDDQMEFGKAE